MTIKYEIITHYTLPKQNRCRPDISCHKYPKGTRILTNNNIQTSSITLWILKICVIICTVLSSLFEQSLFWKQSGPVDLCKCALLFQRLHFHVCIKLLCLQQFHMSLWNTSNAYAVQEQSMKCISVHSVFSNTECMKSMYMYLCLCVVLSNSP